MKVTTALYDILFTDQKTTFYNRCYVIEALVHFASSVALPIGMGFPWDERIIRWPRWVVQVFAFEFHRNCWRTLYSGAPCPCVCAVTRCLLHCPFYIFCACCRFLRSSSTTTTRRCCSPSW